MFKVNITPDYLSAKTEKLRALNKEHEQLIQSIYNEVKDLHDMCSDEGTIIFFKKIEEMKHTFEKFSAIIDAQTDLLDTASKQIEQPACELAKAFL